MALMISTNMYTAEDFRRVLPYLKTFDYRIGVEVFPMFHKQEYESILQECLPELSRVPISFHGPYAEAEHSVPVPGEGVSDGKYEKTMEMMRTTIKYSRALNSRYIVYHHNNCRVLPEKKEEMIRISCENYREVEKMAGDIPVLVENAGVMDRGTMMFDQEEFIDLCLRGNYKVLIDIGHAHANGWDITKVMERLGDRIWAYHLHNNDGIHDSHRRIHDGTLDFEKFLSDYSRITPEADLVLEYSLDINDDVEGIERDVEYLNSYLCGGR